MCVQRGGSYVCLCLCMFVLIDTPAAMYVCAYGLSTLLLPYSHPLFFLPFALFRMGFISACIACGWMHAAASLCALHPISSLCCSISSSLPAASDPVGVCRPSHFYQAALCISVGALSPSCLLLLLLS
eukprot:GHVS01056966.1.p3 GENE.GHVS01056966.1~~GHVS01056966.1.p3  ORF type:complete len:128 (-),score=23.17 GHVS01056966.1:1269-1652(-)